MVINEKHPLLGSLIRACPDMFNITEIVGAFDGSELVCNFIKNHTYLKSITCYENFSFTDDAITIDKFKKLYVSWEEHAPNVIVKLEDGVGFNETCNYVHIENDKPGGQPAATLHQFVMQNSHKLQNKWFSISGFNTNMGPAYNVFKLLDSHHYYPVMIIADFIFLTLSYELYLNYFTRISHFAELNDIKSRVEKYNGHHKTIKLLTDKGITWQDRIARAGE